MAVQQNRKSRSKRGMRRAHDALTARALSEDSFTGETHIRHHITPEGYYRGKKVVDVSRPIKDAEATEEANEE